MGKKVVSELMHTFCPPNKIYFPRNIKIQFVFQEPFVALIALSFFHRFLLKLQKMLRGSSVQFFTLILTDRSKYQEFYPPASKASREVANLNERKNPHTPLYIVSKNLSVCLFTKLDPNYLRTGKTKWAEIFSGTSMAKSHVSKKIWSGKVAGRAGAKGQNSNNCPDWPHSQGRGV